MANSLFRKADVEAIEGKIKEIIDFAQKKKLVTLEPNYKEYLAVNSIVTDYIKKNQRIVYGGIALNEYIKEKSPKDVIYKDIGKNDIEIYSPDPVLDVKSMCDILYKQKYKYIEGKEADHPGTFTIFVNFDKYCDITYVPKLVYHNLPFIKVNGFRLIHPSIILTDTLRVYTDPLTSYYRLDKTFDRTNKLLKVAKFEPKKGVIKEDTTYTYIINALVPKIANIKTLIFVDDTAYNYYMEQVSSKKLKESHIGLSFQDFQNNAQKIYNALLDIVAEKDKDFRQNLKVDEYNIFFQFWERRIVISYKKTPIVTMYQNKDKCYQFREIERYNTKINIGNFTLVLLYYLIHYQYNGIFRLETKELEYRLGNLLDAKNTYLTKHDKTVLDDTPFQEFQIECLGETIDFQRKNRLKLTKRRELNKNIVYRYQPDEEKNSLTEEYSFPNEAGTLIMNDKLKFIKL